MHSQSIRKKFLNYFHEQGHTIVPSSSVVPHDDPTLLFCNAGMNQFKDVFLGKAERDYKRATSSQKCIRVGGKHNDLENVGHTTRHLTFFEMLGNFSFGDYFKEDAIKFAWEVTSDVFELDLDKVWVSVFREDDEAFELWTRYLPTERIVRLDERDNFWAMGETGPCGPCSELLFDRGDAYGSAPSPYEDTDGERFFEFWNLVFMEFNRDEQGKMSPLPKKCIDTGVGLERAVSLKMGVPTLFETDVLRHLIGGVEELTGKKYDPNEAAFHVVADHLRSLAFAITDGVQPSNVERGYVLRKVLRRAVRYGRQLGLNEPFLAKLMPRLIDSMGEAYHELEIQQPRIEEILTLEEESFFRTLRRGGNLLSQVVDDARKKENKISGDDAFKLKDTYGLPLEEILLIAKDEDLAVDLQRYQKLEQEARERSREVHKGVKQMAEESLFADFVQKHGKCGFVGYTQLQGQGVVIGLFHDGKQVQHLAKGQEGMIVLDHTPFYAEQGGQVGDTGTLIAEGVRFTVTDTQSPYTGVIVHVGKVEEGEIKVEDGLEAAVDGQRRQQIANNHTATHLLHWALQEVLGPHVRQAGSIVAPDRFRFDFSHHKGMTLDEIRQVEDLVNTKIRENSPVESYELAYSEVQGRPDIKQFFGEKYGNEVRVIDISYSKELCGGTHTSSTGNIGAFVVCEEKSIAAGVRRIVGLTGAEAFGHLRGPEDLLNEMADLLKTQPGKLLERVAGLVEETTHYAREMKAARAAKMVGLAGDLAAKVEEINGVPVLIASVQEEPGQLRALADELSKKLPSAIFVIGSVSDGKCALVVKVSQDLIEKGFQAGSMVKELAPVIGGGGGGKKDFAQAGGKEPHKMEEALAKARTLINAG